MFTEHRFITYEQAKFCQKELSKIYGYSPNIIKVTDPITKFIFYVVVEPWGALPIER